MLGTRSSYKPSPRLYLALGGAFLSLTLLVLTRIRYPLVDVGWGLRLLAVFALVVPPAWSAGRLARVRKDEPSARERVLIGLFALWGGVAFALALLLFANAQFDPSAAEVVQASVRGKYARHGRSAGYFVVVDGAGVAGETIAVGAREYQSVSPGRTRVKLRLRSGLLGLRWLEGYAFE